MQDTRIGTQSTRESTSPRRIPTYNIYVFFTKHIDVNTGYLRAVRAAAVPQDVARLGAVGLVVDDADGEALGVASDGQTE